MTLAESASARVVQAAIADGIFEEFKLRIAAIIGSKPEHIADAPKPHAVLVRCKKRPTHRKARR